MRAAVVGRSPKKSLLLAMLLVSAAWFVAPASEKTSAISNSRWEEGQPGCTFSRDDDGRYRYGFWADDFGIVLAVDSQEMEKVRRRAQPILELLLSVHYRGKNSLAVAPGKISLEFVKHYHDVHNALDPDNLASMQQHDAEALGEETQREIRKHPEKKVEKEAALAAGQKGAAEMIQFLNGRSLRAVTLDSAHPDAIGWVFFSTKSKWIDDLRKQEQFVLRVPIGERVVEFPFTLPPSEGDLILRTRPEN